MIIYLIVEGHFEGHHAKDSIPHRSNGHCEEGVVKRILAILIEFFKQLKCSNKRQI